MCARYGEKALHHQGALGTGQIAQRLLQEEHHGHKQPREKSCAEDGDNHKGIDQEAHQGLRCASKVPNPLVSEALTSASPTREGSIQDPRRSSESSSSTHQGEQAIDHCPHTCIRMALITTTTANASARVRCPVAARAAAADPNTSTSSNRTTTPGGLTGAQGATKAPHTTAATSGAPMPRATFAMAPPPVSKPQ